MSTDLPSAIAPAAVPILEQRDRDHPRDLASAMAPSTNGIQVGHDAPPEYPEPDEVANPLAERIRAQLVADDALAAIADPEPLVVDLLSLNTTAAIFGQSGAGKSFLAILLAYCVALASDFHGRTVTPGAVLYVAAEGAGGLKRRRAAFRHHYGIEDSANVTWLPAVVDMLDNATAGALVEVAAELAPRVIFLDTLARLSPGGREDAEDMGRFIHAMDRLRDATGACVVAVHHSGKDTDRGARGHSSFVAAMDTVIEVTGDKAAGVVTAKVTKQKDLGSDGERLGWTLEACEASAVLIPDFANASGAGEMTKAQHVALKRLVEIATAYGVTNTEWKNACTEDKTMSARTFDRCRAALIDLEHVEHRDRRYFIGDLPDDIEPTDGPLVPAATSREGGSGSH